MIPEIRHIMLNRKGDGMMIVKKGDIVIKKEKHSCDIRVVEGADETGILLVNGVQDKFYESFEIHLFENEYELLVREEDRLDSFVY